MNWFSLVIGKGEEKEEKKNPVGGSELTKKDVSLCDKS